MKIALTVAVAALSGVLTQAATHEFDIVSASHMAFGSIRMEPVFFALGQVAGTASVLAIDAGVSVQKVDYGKLAARLKADGQVF